MTERIKAGPARSERELSIYTTTQTVCPKCQHRGLIPYGLERSPTAPVALTNCAMCNTHVEVEFSAGPGWGNEPDDPLHFASGDAPSSILPETYFREDIESGTRRVRYYAASDPSAAVAIAADVIGDLLEIRKLHGAFSPSDRKILDEIAKAFVKAGGTLTEDVAKLVSS
jgi:hypothetical protein